MSDVVAWLDELITGPAWPLSGHCVRVAIVIRRLSDESGRSVATLDDLSAMAGVPRSSVRRSLMSLERAGFCATATSIGRNGQTEIRLIQQTFRSAPVGSPKLLSSIEETEPPNGARNESGDQGLEHLETGQTVHLRVVSDQDLLRSPSDPLPESDLRSSDSRDLRRSEISTLENGGTETFRAPRVSVERIPERAWKAADYLRAQLLAVQPTAAIGKPGVKWGPEVRTGRRLQWANEFRLLVEADRRAWDDVARTVWWLFNGQSSEARFVVQSPDALRRKWDRIQAVRMAQSNKPSARGADGRPDLQASREYKRLTPGEL